MSTHITDRIEAVRLPKETTGHYCAVFVVAEFGGDTNVRDALTGRRHREWSATAIGPEWEIIRRACERASACPGGCLKLAKRGYTKPESYIRAYRKALKNAADGFGGADNRGLYLTLRTRFTADESRNGRQYAFDQLAKSKTPTEEERYGEKYLVFNFNRTPDDLKLWINTLNHQRAWDSVDVHGPED